MLKVASIERGKRTQSSETATYTPIGHTHAMEKLRNENAPKVADYLLHQVLMGSTGGIARRPELKAISIGRNKPNGTTTRSLFYNLLPK